MKIYIAALALLAANAFAADSAPQAQAPAHRYIIERTFPAGALDHLDDAAKAKVNANNSSVGVRWIKSFANSDKTKTYCVYEGPNEAAIRKAAQLNALPVDRVMEVPVDLDPGVSASKK
jgi:hypothetical protein